MVAELAKSASCRGYDGGTERRSGGMTGLVSLEGVQQIDWWWWGSDSCRSGEKMLKGGKRSKNRLFQYS